MKRFATLVVLLVAACLAGCGHYLSPSECLTIHDMAGVATDDFNRANADANVPLYAKQMLGGEGLAWNNLDARINNKGSVDPNTFRPKASK